MHLSLSLSLSLSVTFPRGIVDGQTFFEGQTFKLVVFKLVLLESFKLVVFKLVLFGIE